MTRPAAADRAEIEALARELSDNDWRCILNNDDGDDAAYPLEYEQIEALLAYLDSVWAGLSDEEVQDLVDNATPLGRAVLRRARGEAP